MDKSLPLSERLLKYTSSGVCPMHMPGHKRNTGLLGECLPYKLDITEIHDFDNLQKPDGVLKQTAELAAWLYQSGESFLSVNGSTGAILAGVKSCVRPYDKIIMARNCHRSVYNAVELNLLRPVYLNAPIDPQTGIAGSIDPEETRKAVEANPDARLVIITSPTYEGVQSDIRAIAEAVHKCGALLLVDAAHGAHIGFSPLFGESAVQAGADLTVMSLHKTMPALTQCALLHAKSGLADRLRLQEAMNMFQSSSPSYVLLSSIDACLRLIKSDGAELFSAYEVRLTRFAHEMRALRHLRLLCGIYDNIGCKRPFFELDPGKLTVLTVGAADFSGYELARVLRENYMIEIEMAAPGYVVAMTGPCDTDENFRRLSAALLETDRRLEKRVAPEVFGSCIIPECRFAPYEVTTQTGEHVEIAHSGGRVSLEYAWAYPPGVPLIVPGEIIPPEFVFYCRQTFSRGGSLNSTCGKLPDSIFCRSEKYDDKH